MEGGKSLLPPLNTSPYPDGDLNKKGLVQKGRTCCESAGNDVEDT